MTEAAETPQKQTAPKAPENQPGVSSQEIEEGKAFAILSYALSIIGLPFFLVPLITRNNEFALYHAKQTLMIWLLGIAGGVVSGILAFICVGIVLAVALGIFLLVITIIGLINASQGQQKPLPLIGPWGEGWFKGLKKV